MFHCGPVASSAKQAVNMTFCGPARDTLLTNRQTEKLNFDTNYITKLYINTEKNVLYFFYNIAQRNIKKEIFRVDIELYQHGS